MDGIFTNGIDTFIILWIIFNNIHWFIVCDNCPQNISTLIEKLFSYKSKI